MEVIYVYNYWANSSEPKIIRRVPQSVKASTAKKSQV
jgi:hypothetical protein